MKATTTIQIINQVKSEEVPLAKELIKSPNILKQAEDRIKDFVIEEMTNESNETVTVKISYEE